MNTQRRGNGILLLGASLFLFHLGPGASTSTAAQGDDPWKGLRYQNSADCKFCHTLPTADRKESGSLDFVLLTEYAIWKTHDKHAQAYAVLVGPRGKQMGKILGVDVTRPEAGCLNCHAMYNQWMGANYAGKSPDALSDVEKTELLRNLKEGVSCGGCHGPSSKWNGAHWQATWRARTPQQKDDDGMVDLRDPTVRAELCLSCHIGNARQGKVVSHAMFAAGHPPLPPIEIATFSKNQPQHWRDAKDVPAFQNPRKYGIDLKNYHAEEFAFQQTRFALVGNLIAMRETARLARDRAGQADGIPRWGWPELIANLDEMQKAPDDSFRQEINNSWSALALAHSDCYGCHHDLRYPGFRLKRGFGYRLPGLPLLPVRPGRPIVRSWALAGLEACTSFTGQAKELEELYTVLKELARVTSARPFGEPVPLGQAAAGVMAWCDSMRGQVGAEGRYSKDASLQLLHTLCRMYASSGSQAAIPDYESARQVASLIRVVFEEWAAATNLSAEQKEPLEEELARLTEQLDLEPYVHRRDRIGVLLDVIRKAARVGEGDRAFSEGARRFSEYLRQENLTRMDKLQELIDRPNPFLIRLQIGVGSTAFADALIEPETAARLQQYSDAEGRRYLRKIADFNPDQFQQAVSRLNQLLPAASAR